MNVKDFFISYNGKDQKWAEWIAWTLEEAGYSTVIQAWDFRAGGNFILEMQDAAEKTKQTLAVLSENYLGAVYTKPEWAAAFAEDPTGNQRKLIPVRIDNCKPKGMLKPIIYIDLYGLEGDPARDKLLEALKEERGKPAVRPDFPGSGSSSQSTNASPSSAQPQPASPTGSDVVNWETLSGQQQGEFVEALLSAYGSRSTLEQMLLFELNARLGEIAGSGNMREVTTAVVTWAVDNGSAKGLFDGARKRNPGNPTLKGLEAKLMEMVPTPQQSQPSTTSSTGGPPESANRAQPTVSSDNRGISIGGDASGNVIVTGDGNVIHLPPEGAPFPGTDSSSHTASSAIATPDADQILDELTKLVSAQFERVVFALDSGNVIPGKNVAQAERAIELVRLARSSEKIGLSGLWAEIQRVKG